MNIDRKKRKRWLLRKQPFGDLVRGDDQRDKEPWSNDQRSEKPYESGATGPSLYDEHDDSYPVDSHNTSNIQKYLGKPGDTYDTQTHGID